MVLLAAVVMILAMVAPPLGSHVAHAKNPIIFADFGWDSAQVHNRIAAFIIEHGLGYPVSYVQGETIMLNTALIEARGNQAPNVNMETWTENWQDLYDKGEKLGKDPSSDKGVYSVGIEFSQQRPGILGSHLCHQRRFRTRYQTGRAGFEKRVEDAKRYWELFKDPEDPSKGRFYSCIPGWSCALVNEKKIKVYGLEKYFNVMQPGSGPALAASMEVCLQTGQSPGLDTIGPRPGCWANWT